LKVLILFGSLFTWINLLSWMVYLSIWAAKVRSLPQSFKTDSAKPTLRERLTARELQIVELVALGRTNAAIGQELDY
jgi:DNA-binding NarL/FixJ family response regulator